MTVIHKGMHVRHKKRGSTYSVIAEATGQSGDTSALIENQTFVVYQSEHDGRVWVRPKAEFEDGRFEVLPEADPPQDGLREALASAIAVAGEARREWDAAPESMKAGKLLIALSGGCPGYRKDIDAIHAVLAAPASPPISDAMRERIVAVLKPFAKIEVPYIAQAGTWVARTIFCNDQVTAHSVRAARALLAELTATGGK